MLKPRIALITVNETRERFRKIRESLLIEEMEAVKWIEGFAEVFSTPSIISSKDVNQYAEDIRKFNPHLLVIHIPVWTEPVLSIKIAQLVEQIPIVLLGNRRKETSSMVGLFGAGGALDQIGTKHIRIFDHSSAEGKSQLKEIAMGAFTQKELKGQVYGLFGGRSLGMMTATADSAQWQKIFGIDIEHLDQLLIVEEAEKIPAEEVERYTSWLKENTRDITFNDSFDEQALDKQVRSYLATKKIVEERGLDFIGVKCQPELCDSYTTQCIAHTLFNGSTDIDGKKTPCVHACEADADGALTMQILHLISGGKPTALLDMRWQNPDDGIWTLANCGAMAADFGATERDSSGLSSIEIMPHVIGKSGSCALPMISSPGEVTMARLCRKDGIYTLFIIQGEILKKSHDILIEATACFPQAYIKMATDDQFYEDFGSNHLHMVSGNVSNELKMYCDMNHISYQEWK